MRKIYVIICLFVFLGISYGQTKNNFMLKAELMYGSILQHTERLKTLIQDPVVGCELAIEWQTMGEKEWHQYLNFSKVGVGVVGLNLGNPAMLGNLYAVYPYLSFQVFNFNFVKFNIKGGAGASYLTKTFRNTATNLEVLNTGNAAIGSHLNVYFEGGGSLVVPIGKGWAAVADLQWNHASNGSFYQPNSGLNMINTMAGISYTPYYKHRYRPIWKHSKNVPNVFSMELIASGGARQWYYKDTKLYPTGSFVAAVYHPVGNALRLGVGIDAFYDGVYDGNHNSTWQRTYIFTDEIKNKMRIGITLRPELVAGKFTAGIHLGLYVLNPIKNLEPYDAAKLSALNKPLIYPYNIEKEDGWFFSRASLHYALTENVFLALGLKTHLQKAEFIEWGIGYRFQQKDKKLFDLQ
ncbi:MAG: hypothetical protein AUK44_09420 [Porphyromonadaceae bacterium CG2_30_38_12]|nr:MAG: hypothetical protein AUK44_09420 [Porphyromonadaceae bacterium CG2_30_38_12]